GWRRIVSGSSERTMEVDGGDDGFFKAQAIFRSFFFALLLQRTAKNLAFDAPGNGSRRALLGWVGGDTCPYVAIFFENRIVAENKIIRRAVHLTGSGKRNLLPDLLRRA